MFKSRLNFVYLFTLNNYKYPSRYITSHKTNFKFNSSLFYFTSFGLVYCYAAKLNFSKLNSLKLPLKELVLSVWSLQDHSSKFNFLEKLYHYYFLYAMAQYS